MVYLIVPGLAPIWTTHANEKEGHICLTWGECAASDSELPQISCDVRVICCDNHNIYSILIPILLTTQAWWTTKTTKDDVIVTREKSQWRNLITRQCNTPYGRCTLLYVVVGQSIIPKAVSACRCEPMRGSLECTEISAAQSFPVFYAWGSNKYSMRSSCCQIRRGMVYNPLDRESTGGGAKDHDLAVPSSCSFPSRGPIPFSVVSCPS